MAEVKRPPAPLVLAEPAHELPAERNPLLAYLGGVDAGSRPALESAARRAVAALTPDLRLEPANFPWARVNYAVLKRLRSALIEGGLAAATVNQTLALVRGVLKECWILRSISRDDYERALEVKNVKVRRLPAGRYVTRAEIAALLRKCAQPEITPLSARNAAVVCLLVGAGLRENEAASLRRGDWDRERGVIRVRKGKRRKERESYLDPLLDAPLRWWAVVAGLHSEDALLVRFSPSGRIIRPPRAISGQAIDLALGELAAAAGVEPFTPHDLRRSFITNQLLDGVDPIQLARVVGHEDPKTTMLYDKRTAEADRRAIRGETALEEDGGKEELRRAAALFR